jgi:SAM-dependent methyltransferase
MPSSEPPPAYDPARYKESTRETWQQAAEAWHRWGPTLERWFGPATETMLDLAAVGEGDRVLDVAAGAGGQSLAAARRVGPGGSVLATDIAPRILEFAELEARRAGRANVTTRTLDGERLDVDEGAFDAVISRVGFIFFPDQQTALRGIRRALRRGGRIAGIVYSTPERNPFFSVPLSIIRRRARLPAQAPGQPGPFSLGGEGEIAAAYERAGFGDVDVRYMDAPLRLASTAECVRFERESFGVLRLMLAGLGEAEREEAWREIETELRRFEGDDGFEAPCELIVAAGTR